jgi:LemA protein
MRNQFFHRFSNRGSVAPFPTRGQLRLALIAVLTVTALSATAQLPGGWQMIGFGAGRAATNQTVEHDAGRWMIKTGPSRSAILHQSFSGDITLTAKFLEATGPNNAQLGLTLWAAISPTAGNIGLLLDPQGQKLTVVWEETTDRTQTALDSIQLDGIGFPVWLRLSRVGSLFHAAYSKDGQEWRPVGLPVKTFWAGNRPEIFASVSATGEAQFRLSDLTVRPTAAIAASELPAPWQLGVRGQPAFLGQAALEGGTFRLTGVNSRGRAGNFGVTALQPVTNRVQLTTTVRLADLADPKSAAGLLLAGAGVEAGLHISPSGGQLRWFARRAEDGRFTQVRNFPIPPSLVGRETAQLRIALVEGRLAGFQRSGTEEWTQVGETLTLPELAADVRGGVELASESASRAVQRASFEALEVMAIATLPVKPAPTAVAAANRPSAPANQMAPAAPRPAPVYYAPPPPPRWNPWWWQLLKLGFWLLVILALFLARPFNRLVRLRNQMRKAWAQIDVQLKRRHDLIQNLVETVKGYAKHEQSTLEGVTQARANAVSAQSPGARANAEEKLNQSLRSLYAVVENYPDLKANQNFATLQQNLTATEDKIAAARHTYNEEVVHYNNEVQTFPTNLVARIFRFRAGDFFELGTEQEREVSAAKF